MGAEQSVSSNSTEPEPPPPSPSPPTPVFGPFGGPGTVVATLAGNTNINRISSDGIGTSALFTTPRHMALSSDGLMMYIAESGSDTSVAFHREVNATNHHVRVLNVATGAVTTLAGSGALASSTDAQDGTGTSAMMGKPVGIAITSDDSTLYVSEHHTHRIRQIDISTAKVTTLAGRQVGSADGVGTNALFNEPSQIAITGDGTTLYVADTGNHQIRALDISTRMVTTLVGSSMPGHADGTGTNAMLYDPRGIAITSGMLILLVTPSACAIQLACSKSCSQACLILVMSTFSQMAQASTYVKDIDSAS